MKPLRPTHPYIPMARGFVYLAVVLDWFSRRVLSWRAVDHHGGGVLRRDAGGGAGEARQTVCRD